MKQRSMIFLVAVLLIPILGVGASEEKQPTTGFSSLSATLDDRQSADLVIPHQGTEKGGGILVDLDITSVPSWGNLNDPDNVVILENIGADGVMTGLGWDLNICTVDGGFSDSAIYFDEQSLDGTGLFLTFPPETGHSSSPVIDLSDNGIADIVAGPDGQIYIQFFESFDDIVDGIDAYYDTTSCLPGAGDPPSTLTLQIIPGAREEIPTLSSVASIGLAMLLAGLGIFLMRRRGLTHNI